MPVTIHEIAESGQERACYIASGGGVGEVGGGRRDVKGRVDVVVSFGLFSIGIKMTKITFGGIRGG